MPRTSLEDINVFFLIYFFFSGNGSAELLEVEGWEVAEKGECGWTHNEMFFFSEVYNAGNSGGASEALLSSAGVVFHLSQPQGVFKGNKHFY